MTDNSKWWKIGGLSVAALTLATLGYAAIPGYALLAYYAGRASKGDSNSNQPPTPSDTNENTGN